MNDKFQDLETVDDLVLTEFEEEHFDETLAERMSAPVIVHILSSDDGFDVDFDGHTVEKDRGTASNNDLKVDVFDKVREKYLNTRIAHDEDGARAWRRTLRKIGAGRSIPLLVKCWNAGGPSAITYKVSASGGNTMGGRRIGSHKPGITHTSTYEVRYDRTVRTSFIVVPPKAKDGD